MANFEGIFKTKKGFFERVDHNFNQLNLENKVYEKCFKKDEECKYTYALNDKLKLAPITFKNAYEKNNYIKNFKDLKPVYGFDEWIEYTNKKYWKKEIPKPKIMYLDIETIDLNNRKFPQPHLAEAPVTHIQIMINNTIIILYIKEPSKEILENHKEVKFIKCVDEKDIFLKFSMIVNKTNPSIVTAYNGNLFDFPYLMFRAMKLGFSFENLSPLKEVSFRIEFKHKSNGEYKKYYDLSKLKEFLLENLTDWKIVSFQLNVKGQYWIDYLELFKTFMKETLPSYKLEYVAYKYLKEGEGKVDYGEYTSIFDFYEKDYDKFFEYAIQDPVVIKNLEEKLQLINTLTLLAYLMGCNYDTAMATVQPWAIHLRHIGLKQNIILPNDTRQKLDKPIIGGFVKEPIKGLSEWLFSIDFNSLYPSIMDMLNMCGTTYIPYEKLPIELKEIYDLFRDEDESKLLNDIDLQKRIKTLTHKYNVSFNGQGFFRRDKRGMIAQIVADIYYQRKEEKTKMLLANAIMKNNEK